MIDSVLHRANRCGINRAFTRLLANNTPVLQGVRKIRFRGELSKGGESLNISRNPLHTIMAPKSIAIVGASNNPMKMGSLQFLNIKNCGFPGAITPVHPKHDEVFGVKAYPTISSLPEAPELAILVVPTGLVIPTAGRFRQVGNQARHCHQRRFSRNGRGGVKTWRTNFWKWPQVTASVF